MFVRVVESGSFTNAARALSVPTSSVSRAVAALEEELGVLLIQRTTRKLVLTTGGAAFFERAREALTMFDGAAEAALDDKAPRGLVRITAPMEASAFLATQLTAFRQRHPDIRVDAILTPRYVDLLGEGVDIALRAGVLQDQNLIARRVMSSYSAMFAAPEYLARRGTPKALADLHAHDLVVHRGKADKTTWELEGPNGPERVVAHGSIIGDGLSFVMGCVMAGAGIGMLPAARAQELQAAGLIERVLPEYSSKGADFSVVVTSRQLPARVTLLRDFLIEALLTEDSQPCTKARRELLAHAAAVDAPPAKLAAE